MSAVAKPSHLLRSPSLMTNRRSPRSVGPRIWAVWRQRNLSSQSAFTLIEILAVVAMMAMIIGLASQYLNVGKARIRSTAQELTKEIQGLHVKTIESGKIHRIAFSIEDGEYQLQGFEEPKPKPKEEDREALEKWEEEQKERNAMSGIDRAEQTRIERGSFKTLKKKTLPSSVKILKFISSRKTADEAKNGSKNAEKKQDFLYFFPSGEVDQSLIVLKDLSDRAFSLSVSGLSGKVTVYPEELTEDAWKKKLKE